MPRGDRSARPKTKLVAWIVGSLGIGTIAGAGGYGLFQQGTYSQETRQQAADYAEHSARKIQQSCIRLTALEKAQCIANAQAEHELKTRDNRREYDDLLAQRKSALWTFIMGMAAVIGMALSAIGVFLVKQTFDQTRQTNRIALKEGARSTRRAVKSAEESTKALAIAERNAESAAEQVALSASTAQKQLRAYVGPQAINYTYDDHGNVGAGRLAASAEVINYGQTPAFGFRMLGSLNYIPFPITELPNVGFPEEATHTLYPTQKTYISVGLPVDAQRISEIRSALGCFILTIVVEYFDHAGQRHLETTRLYTTNNLNLNIWNGTHTATMTYHSSEVH